MSRTLTRFIAAILGLFLVSAAQSAPKTYDFAYEGLSDGDTIYVRDLKNRASYRIRLAMIDAPESKQAYGPQAKASLAQALRGAGNLKVKVYAKDRYGRLVGMVFDERGRNLNLLQVSQGAAWVYSTYAERPEYRSDYNAFMNAERSARMQSLGLWSSPNPIEPWNFRRR